MQAGPNTYRDLLWGIPYIALDRTNALIPTFGLLDRFQIQMGLLFMTNMLCYRYAATHLDTRTLRQSSCFGQFMLCSKNSWDAPRCLFQSIIDRRRFKHVNAQIGKAHSQCTLTALQNFGQRASPSTRTDGQVTYLNINTRVNSRPGEKLLSHSIHKNHILPTEKYVGVVNAAQT